MILDPETSSMLEDVLLALSDKKPIKDVNKYREYYNEAKQYLNMVGETPTGGIKADVYLDNISNRALKIAAQNHLSNSIIKLFYKRIFEQNEGKEISQLLSSAHPIQNLSKKLTSEELKALITMYPDNQHIRQVFARELGIRVTKPLEKKQTIEI